MTTHQTLVFDLERLPHPEVDHLGSRIHCDGKIVQYEPNRMVVELYDGVDRFAVRQYIEEYLVEHRAIMPKWEVWYAKRSTFDSTVRPKTVKELLANYVKVKEMVALDEEQVFNCMQSEIWSPNGEALFMITGLGLSHTSMSIGDLLCYRGHWKIASDVGFDDFEIEGI